MSLYPWQQSDWQRLQHLRQRLPQGVLLKGPVGIGKLSLARHFAQSLLCQAPQQSGLACDACASCHWFVQHNHPDFRLIQPENLNVSDEPAAEGGDNKKASKQISVDDIRELADFVTLSSHQGGVRVVLIYPAEAMNVNAANALLKSLEEPPPGVLFLLVSHQSQQLLPTILSRCVSVALTVPDRVTAEQWLQQQGVNNAQAMLAAAGFSPLRALNVADELNLEQRELLLAALAKPAQLDVFAVAENLQKLEQVQVVAWLQQWCYDLMSWQLAGVVRYYPQHQKLLQTLSQQIDPLCLLQWQKHLQQARRESTHTLNSKLFFEAQLLRYAALMRT